MPSTLERHLADRGIPAADAMDHLQEHGIISDNAITPADVGNDAAAIDWLTRNPLPGAQAPPADKPRYPHAEAMAVAQQILAILAPACARHIVAGSLRRRKPTVGDIEILYIPRTETFPDPTDLWATMQVDHADEAIAQLERDGILERRKNVNGSEMFGPKNKLMRHVVSGIPVDLFSADTRNWHNYLVCRTGPAQSNTRIATAAQAKGWKWNPYGAGFSRGGPLAGDHEEVPMNSEREVFAFVGLPYAEPEARA